MDIFPVPIQKKQYFENRYDAGKKLAGALLDYQDENPFVLALPRGGVPLGYEIAKELNAPLDVIISRKIGSPNNAELGIGAIAENNIFYLDMDTVQALGTNKEEIEKILKKEHQELIRRVKKYREGKDLPSMKGKAVIIVDDGLATGVTAHAAIQSVQKLEPRKVILAAPVCAYDTARAVRDMVDDFECLYSPHDLKAIGAYYNNFDQISDNEVMEILHKYNLN